MMSGIRQMLRWIAVFGSLMAGACPACADEVRLRPSVTASSDQALTIGELAVLDGPHAEALAGIVVFEGATALDRTRGWTEVGIGEVRRALRNADASLGRVALSGGRCVIRLSDVGVRPQRKGEPATARAPEVVEAGEFATVRSEIARAMAHALGVGPLDVRLLFDDREESFLAMGEDSGRIVVDPIGAVGSERVLVRARLVADERIVAEQSLSVMVEVRRPVVMLLHDVARGQVLMASDLVCEAQWVRPTGFQTFSSVEEAAGTAARKRISGGSILRSEDIELPVLVKRGELVTVVCLSNGVAIQTLARSRADGRLGELIELRRDGSSESFTARVDGRGRVVIDLDTQRSRGGAPIAGRL